MEKIKILMVIPSLDGGGAERVMLNITNHLDRERFEVYLYVERFEGKYAAELRPDVQVICAEHRRGLTRLLFLRREIKRLKPSVVFIMMLPIAAISVRLACVGSIPVIRETESRPMSQVKQSWIARLLNRLGMRLAKRLVAPAEGAKQYLKKRYGMPADKITVIHNPVNISDIQLAAGESLPQKQDVVNLISVGRLKYQKGFDLLLDALAHVKQFRWRLKILGSGPLEEDLKQQARDNGIGDSVEFLGFQQNPYALLRQSDLFILSSRWEGLPNVVLEAMAAGVAVLATRCPTGPEEIITPGESGALCDISVDGLREQIEQLGASATLRESLVEGGNRRIQDFDLPQIVNQYEQFFMRCTTINTENTDL
ncbi:MAG: glycosyltransferase [Planctomycetota bacterium]|nr:glycosyltransferase [Planctomycetota bacterium]